MTAIVLGISNYVRTLGKTVPVLLTNMYVEKDPANLIDGLVRLQRPALSLFTTLDAGNIGGVFQSQGTFNGDYLIASGGMLYRVTINGVATLLGFIGTDARCSFAASRDMVVIATGGIPYRTDGTTVTQIIMPNGENVTSVEFMDNYFILTVEDSQRYFWLAPAETDPDGLEFSSAENSPDDISVVKRLGDELWFFGKGKSTEVHIATGLSDLPFKRVAGRLYDIGNANRHTIANTDNTLFWVGTDRKVYRASGSPLRISDHGIEEALRINDDDTNLKAWAFAIDGHTFYVLTIGDLGTFVYDVENGTSWYKWASFGRDTWRAHIGTNGNSAPVLCGDDTDGRVYLLDPTSSQDDDEQPMIREITGAVAVLGKPIRCDDIQVFASTGWSPDVDVEPFMEVNWSDDGGMSFPDAWIPMSLGAQGDLAAMIYAQQLGIIYPPGRVFKFRMGDNANWRVSYARMNEM